MLEEVLPTKIKEHPNFFNWQKLEKVSQVIRELKCWEVRLEMNPFFFVSKYRN